MHRSQEIINTITTLLTGLDTTGSNVAQTRVYPARTTPAITIQRGADTIEQILNGSVVDRFLEVIVSIHVSDSPDQLDLVASNVAEETYIAMIADITLGLDYVIDTDLIAEQAPEMSPDAETPTMLLQQQWRIHYRHSYTDPAN